MVPRTNCYWNNIRKLSEKVLHFTRLRCPGLGVEHVEQIACNTNQIENYHPDYFVSGHAHAFPYMSGQSWNQAVNGVRVLVPGQLLRASIPNYILLNPEQGEASWHSSSETWIPEDGLFDHLVLKL